MKELKKNTGITLIALVISIIVMLILAGVSLNATIGDNGIVTRAQQAKIAQEDAELWEQLQMVLVEGAGKNLEKEELVEWVNNEFKNRGLEATLSLMPDGYALTYGKYSRKVALLDWKLVAKDEMFEAVESTSELWGYEVKPDGTIKLTEYNKEKEGDIVIPNIVDGKFVTEIGDMFSTSNIKSVAIPGGIEIIDDNAFMQCQELNCAINFPSTLKQIGSYAFYQDKGITGDLNAIVKQNIKMGKNVFGGCSGLTGDVQVLIDTLEDSVTEIAEGQFSGFSGVTGTLRIPKRITKIGNNAFYGCSSIEGIEFEEESELTEIGNNAFDKCSSAKNVLTIPEQVTTIGSYAFNECSKLTGLVLDNALTSMGEYAFYGCTSMTGSLTIPASISRVEQNTFYGDNFTELTFEDGENLNVLQIGNLAFMENASLNSVHLSNRTINFGNQVFYNNSKLSIVTGFENVNTIGTNVFASCRKLENINLEKIKTISNNCFSNCTSLKKLPSTNSALTSIGTEAFSNCTGIESMDIINYLKNSNITVVGAQAFTNCTSLYGNITSDIIQNKNRANISISGSAFNGTQVARATELNLAGKTNIANKEFSGVTKFVDSAGQEIKEINIPQTVTSIGAEAFSGCTSITKVVIPNSVKSIGDNAFYGCSNLSSVTLPQNEMFTRIPTYCFAYCGKITKIDFPSNIKTIGAYSFRNAGIQNLNSNLNYIETIENHAFYCCFGLTSVKFGNQLKSIGTIAFAENYSLTGDIVIPDSVISIGNDATFYNTRINSITLGNQITYIPSRCFHNCTSLKTVTVRASIQTIAYDAFRYCSSLTSINLDWGKLTSIGDKAFNGCTNLRGEAILSRNCTYNIENSFANCPLTVKKQ